MMTDATLVLLDEPGAGVNRTLLAEIAHAIRTLNAERGYSFCIIEHDMGFIAELCDPVICMAEGRVLCEGTMAEVRRDPRVLEAYPRCRGEAACLLAASGPRVATATSTSCTVSRSPWSRARSW
ncbi:MAG: hypothetical protein R3D25_18290 [Geminicoccaceae bacterium]